MKLKLAATIIATFCLLSCGQKIEVNQISTTEFRRWEPVAPVNGNISDTAVEVNISISEDNCHQTVKGFGACFNELGWTSLAWLSEEDRNTVMKELFHPTDGARFNICRMPIGANDFSRDWYSYNETQGDFDMKNFSIANDEATLIPFIKSALHYQPQLILWASPWSPPSWMKYNGHYASAYTGNEVAERYRNGLAKDSQGYEGTDMFIQDSQYMKAYSLYFSKFIDAYEDRGIFIWGIMPQNEFNSAQIFPSCCWTTRGLAKFVGEYLGPTMFEKGKKVMFGTMERSNSLLVDTLLQDQKAGSYISGVGFQWAGKESIAKIHSKYPDMLLLQTEQECGDGKNDWNGMLYSWDLMKHYFNNGVSIYNYWNISLEEGGISRWGWAQNSLVVVNPVSHSYRYTYEYYLMKHISCYVEPRARRLAIDNEDMLAFLNPNGNLVVLYMDKTGKDHQVCVNADNRTIYANIEANSLNTICINKY